MKGDAIMKRKIMAILLAAAITGSLAGCGSTQDKNAADASEQKMKVAMVTDSGDITDQSFNQMRHVRHGEKKTILNSTITNHRVTPMKQEQQVWIRQ